MHGIFRFFADFLGQGSVLIALVVMVGLLVQKKSFSVTISGTLKAFIGFLMIAAGAGVVSGSLGPFGAMFQHGFHVQGVVPNNEAIVALTLEKYGAEASLIMTFAFLVHLLIARFTPIKFIFLTGHHTLYFSVMMTAIYAAAGIHGVTLIALGAVSTAIAMSVSPLMSFWAMPKVTGSKEVALGHFSNITYCTSAFLGKIFGKGSRSTEDLKLPKWLGFMRDNTIAIGLTMIILYILVAIVAGPAYVQSQLSKGMNFIVYAIIEGATFSVGVTIILMGVRMILAELVPAYKGISDKIIPNSTPALDCPIVFPFAPNAVIIGFLCSFLGGIVGLLVLYFVHGTLILPGVVPHFFVGGTAGVLGNATGGRRGCVIGSFVNGVVITFLPLLLMPLLGQYGIANATFSDGDFIAFGSIYGYITHLFV